MRKVRAVGACALLLALAACTHQSGAGAPGDESPSGASRSPSGYGATFLDQDECSTQGRTSFREVSCVSEKAFARVMERYDGQSKEGPRCPERTDFVLHISQSRPEIDEDGDGSVPQGYACMRNLEPPHPGDPGGGGGPRTIVGDCVYTAREGQVRETACDGSGENPPEFRVIAAVARRAVCPASTALYVQVGGEKPVGCARRV